MASIWVLQFHSLPFQPSVWGWKHRVSSNGTALLLHHSLSRRLNRIPLTPIRRFLLRAAINNSLGSEEDQPARNEVVDSSKHTLVVHSKDPIATFQKSVTSSPPVVFLMKRCPTNKLTMGLCIAIAIMVVTVRAYVARKSRQSCPGSVADLVRRGQLRSDRRDPDLSSMMTI